MIVSSFIIQGNVIMIVNYNRKTFIVQATGAKEQLYSLQHNFNFKVQRVSKNLKRIVEDRVRVTFFLFVCILTLLRRKFCL